MRSRAISDSSERSAAIAPSLGLIVGFSVLLLVTVDASDPVNWNDPGWWTSYGAMNTNTANNSAVANQGELKQFTSAAVKELNADLSNAGGAGLPLSNLVYGWQQDYATNGYATNTAAPYYGHKPSDYQAVNVGQLKYIASLLYDQLSSNGYTGLYPSWIVENTSTDTNAASIGQLKTVFNFDLDVAPNAVENLTAIPSNPGEVDLSWALPTVNAATSIIINYSTNGGQAWNTLTTISPTSTAYSATGLDPDLSYEFSVATSNNNPSTGQPQTGNSPPATSATNAPPSPRYAVIDLGTNFVPVGMNTNGIVAGNTPASYTNEAEVWSNGITTVLQPGTETTYGYGTRATAISDSGTVVGSANFLYTNVTVSPNQVRGEGHGCAWTNTTTPPTDLDSASPSLPQHDETGPYAYYYASYATGISSQGIVYGYYNSNDGNVDEPIQFGAAGSPPEYASASWDALAGTPTNNYTANPGCSINSVGGTNWIGAYTLYTYSGGPFQSGYIVNGHLVADNFPGTGPLAFACFAGGINTNGVGVGSDPSGPTMIQNLAVTHLPGTGSAAAINNYAIITPGNPPLTNPAPQIVGVDSTGTNAVIWDQTTLSGTNTVNSTYIPKPLSELVAKNGTNAIWQVSTATGINDSGAIVGTANYVGTNSAIPAGQHGVMLLPIEFVTNDGQGGFATQTFTFNGTATPVINASSSTATIAANNVVSATVAGVVTDDTSDCTPTASKQVQSLSISEGANTYNISLSNSGTPDPTNPWQPYKFAGNFSQSLSFTANGPGNYPIELTTSANAAGMSGAMELMASVTTKNNLETYNVQLPTSFSIPGTNQIIFYEGASSSESSSQILTKTGPGTNIFTGNLPFANVSLVINTFSGLTSAVDQLEATITFTYSNGETKQTDVQFYETGATTDLFSAQVPEPIDGIDLGGNLNLTLPSTFSPSSPDTVQTFVGSTPPTQGAFVLTETGNNSLCFVGTTSWAEAQAQIVDFTGLTAGVDTINVQWTFTYDDGHQVTLNVPMVETGPTTNQFVYNLGAKQIYNVALFPSSTTGKGNFSPTIIRFKGPELEGLTVNVMGTDWQVAQKTYNNQTDWYVVDSNNNPVVFNPSANAHTDIQTTTVPSPGLSVVFKTPTGGIIGTHTLPVVTGLLVQGQDISSLLGNLTNWKVQSYVLGSGSNQTTVYSYTPKPGQTLGYNDTTVGTEILWRYVGTPNTVVKFNSQQELSNDMQYRQTIINLATSAAFHFGGSDAANPKFWTSGNLDLGPINPTTAIPAINDIFNASDAPLYQMGCADAAGFLSLEAASNVLGATTFNAAVPSLHNNPVLYINQVTTTRTTSNLADWIPGDFGYIVNVNYTATANINDSAYWGENILYLGGSFALDVPTFEQNASFYGHGGGTKSLSSWISTVAGFNGGSSATNIYSTRRYLLQP